MKSRISPALPSSPTFIFSSNTGDTRGRSFILRFELFQYPRQRQDRETTGLDVRCQCPRVFDIACLPVHVPGYPTRRRFGVERNWSLEKVYNSEVQVGSGTRSSIWGQVPPGCGTQASHVRVLLFFKP
jgi:hypothetical protein